MINKRVKVKKIYIECIGNRQWFICTASKPRQGEFHQKYKNIFIPPSALLNQVYFFTNLPQKRRLIWSLTVKDQPKNKFFAIRVEKEQTSILPTK